MDIKDFSAGTFLQEYKYKSFSPSKVNEEWTWSDASINSLLEEANFKLGELNAFSIYTPNIDMFIQMHVAKEAETSSRIEGTRTGIEDVIKKESDVSPELKDDWREVQNYIAAMNFAVERLAKIPLSTRLICETHKRLMKNVRGESKLPGEFRRSQNWIGGASLKDAVFIPPRHEEVHSLMNDLEKFLHNEKIHVPKLIKIAIAHYQFETIHPFLDGNGRIGRLMITLYLVSNGLLLKPTLYLSDFFEKNKSFYYDNLTFVRTSNALEQWIKFFLVGVTETCTKGVYTLQKILQLKEEIESKKIIKLGTRISKAKKLIDDLFQVPYANAAHVSALLNVSPATAQGIIGDFEKLGILKEVTGYKRNRFFVFEEYLNLFKGK